MSRGSAELPTVAKARGVAGSRVFSDAPHPARTADFVGSSDRRGPAPGSLSARPARTRPCKSRGRSSEQEKRLTHRPKPTTPQAHQRSDPQPTQSHPTRPCTNAGSANTTSAEQATAKEFLAASSRKPARFGNAGTRAMSRGSAELPTVAKARESRGPAPGSLGPARRGQARREKQSAQ